jgi:methylmalonyl-CoA mutase cobalamin-binding subunit
MIIAPLPGVECIVAGFVRTPGQRFIEEAVQNDAD